LSLLQILLLLFNQKKKIEILFLPLLLSNNCNLLGLHSLWASVLHHFLTDPEKPEDFKAKRFQSSIQHFY